MFCKRLTDCVIPKSIEIQLVMGSFTCINGARKAAYPCSCFM